MKSISFLFLLFLQLVAKGQAERYAVLIHEIMADPSPVIGLPNTEYIELKNNSNQAINLFHWKINNGTTTATINTQFLLQPDSFVIVCSRTQAALFNEPNKTLGITSFPSITNEEDIITLQSAENKTIHSVSFETSWYQDAIKANGGWSLEMIDPSAPCAPNNWKASTNSKGGSPGFQNSVHGKLKQTTPTRLLQCFALNRNTLLLSFDTALDSLSLTNTANYTFSNSDLSVVQAKALAPLFNEVELKTNTGLDSNKIYMLTLKDAMSCLGEQKNNFSIKTGLVKLIDKGDLVFNELLFDPLPGGVDFIEVVNTSNGIVNAKDIYISNRNTDGSINGNADGYLKNFTVFPFEPVVFTTDTVYVRRNWQNIDPSKLLLVKSLPSMPDDRGNVLLLNPSGVVIDEVNYALDMHFPLLRNRSGVALEKIDLSASSKQKDNWHSASSSDNYATPTKENSQRKTTEKNKNWIQVEQNVLRPGNDGIDNLLQIDYQFESPGTLLSVYLFNQQGVQVCKILNNLICGKKGSYNWKGLDNQSNYINTGVYILVAEAFHLNGMKKRYKKVIGIKRV